MSQYLYKVEFNDFGSDYAVGESFTDAGDRVIAFYGKNTIIKKIELIGEVANEKDRVVTRIHL